MSMTRRWTGRLWRAVVALALMVGLAAPIWPVIEGSAQGVLPATAAAAPESTVLFHSLDLDRDGAQWQQSEKLLARVGLPDALDLWEDAILEEGAAAGDFTEADLDALLGGEMAIVVTPLAVERVAAKHAARHGSDTGRDAADATPTPRSGDRGHGVVGILVPGDADAAWVYVQNQFADLARELDVEVQESAYGEADVLAIARRDRSAQSGMDHDDPMAEWLAEFDLHRHDSLVAARAGDFIIAGASEADVTGIIDVIGGSAPSLADSAKAQVVAAELPGDALSFTYVDGQGIVDALGPELITKLEGLAPTMPREAWGGQVGFAISAGEPGFRFDTITIPSAEASLDAMLVANDPAVATAAEQAPAGTFVFHAGRLPETAYAGAPYMLAQAVNAATAGDDWSGDREMMDVPTGEEMEEEIATATATLGFDPAADLFDLLGYEFIAFTSFPSFTFESYGLDAVAAVSTTDPDALAETAGKIAALIEGTDQGVEVSERSIGGDTVHVVSEPATEVHQVLEFGVVADQAVIAIGDGLADLTTEPASSLADDPQFQTVMGQLPGEYYQVGYVDVGQLIAPLVALTGGMETPETVDAAATPGTASGGPENIRALGAVAFQRGEMAGASAILYIAEPGS